MLYMPWQQELSEMGQMNFGVRASSDPLALVPSVRKIIHSIDANLPITEIKTQLAQASESLMQDRLIAHLLGFFGLLALLLAALGLYGVMSYAVAQRTNEISIRMALGAQTRDVLRLIVGQGLRLVFLGLGIGAISGYALQRITNSESFAALASVKKFLKLDNLYGVKASDPLTFLLVAVLLLTVALLACLIPARRATKVDPMIALRQE